MVYYFHNYREISMRSTDEGAAFVNNFKENQDRVSQQLYQLVDTINGLQ